MIDLRMLRERRDEIEARLLSRGVDKSEIDDLVRLDEEFRSRAAERDSLRAQVNALSKAVGDAMRAKDTETASTLREESRAIGEQLVALESATAELEEERLGRLLLLPNVPAEATPVGSGEEDNVIVRYWHPERGMCAPADYTLPLYEESQRVPHWDVGAELGILDRKSVV